MVSAQDSKLAPAPAPTMDARAAFSLPICAAFLGKAATMVSAQDSKLAPAPAPTMDARAAFSLPICAAFLGHLLCSPFLLC
ncbi:hypothetical protein CFP56_006480 [Quercus suber]|uniref:Uncharacterized protein n=1 Tax=Quercus suber TaxID=58331 RepID=A0AAW0L8F0_QUESU